MTLRHDALDGATGDLERVSWGNAMIAASRRPTGRNWQVPWRIAPSHGRQEPHHGVDGGDTVEAAGFGVCDGDGEGVGSAGGGPVAADPVLGRVCEPRWDVGVADGAGSAAGQRGPWSVGPVLVVPPVGSGERHTHYGARLEPLADRDRGRLSRGSWLLVVERLVPQIHRCPAGVWEGWADVPEGRGMSTSQWTSELTGHHRLFRYMRLVDWAGPGAALVAVTALATRLGDPSSVPMMLIFLLVGAVGVLQAVRRRSWGESVAFSFLAGIICGATFSVVSSHVGGGGSVVNFLSVAAGGLVAGSCVVLLTGMVALARAIHLSGSVLWGHRKVSPKPDV